MLLKKDLLYPEFLECCKFTDSSYWKAIFEDLAYGICPYSTYVYKGVLYCNSSGKEFNYRIGKDPKVLYSDIISLFTKKLNLYSNEEKLKGLIDFEEFREKLEFETWGDIKKKNIKNSLIENFVLDLKDKYSLSLSDSKKLLSLLFIVLIFKLIDTSEISIDKERISDISGISYSEGRINFNISKNKFSESPSFDRGKIIFQKKKSFKDEWKKYLDSLKD